VGQGETREEAQNNALSQIALVFNTTVRSLTTTATEINEAESNEQNNHGAAITENKTLSESVSAEGAVTGLMGAETDFWTWREVSHGGMIDAVVFINRKEGAARYGALIDEDEKTIHTLSARAQVVEESDPLAAAGFYAEAEKNARVCDTLCGMRSVLDPNTANFVPSYGSAGTLDALKTDSLGKVKIKLTLTGDSGGTMRDALGTFFNQNGMSVVSRGKALYTLSAALALTNEVYSGSDFKYVRWALSVRLVNADGRQVFSFSGSDREGHETAAKARERALRAAAQCVTDGDFAEKFMAFLNGPDNNGETRPSA
jgi:hypothetical protein